MMLESLKQSGREISHGINRVWRNSSEGWHELLHRSSEALTHFAQPQSDRSQELQDLSGFPQWGLLAAEIEETEREVLIRLEMPGMSKENCTITVAGNMLSLRGEKHAERETANSTFHMRECAYGAFQRVIPLPRNAVAEKAQAEFKDGVLRVRIPKQAGRKPTSIQVN